MNFREAETYLLSLGNEVETMKLGLDNIRKLLAALGDPQTKYLKVQVAGTNGKGSVCAFLDSICREAGINTGVFTSPHLVSIRERIRINGEDIVEDDFARHATKVRETAQRMIAAGDLEYTPTFFEQITAIALIAFAEANIELAILETGLGGRLDATTAANAEIAAITRIDLDHQEYLGETIEEIAAEKAAIIDGPLVIDVVLGKQRAEIANVLSQRCEANGIEPVTGESELDWKIRECSIPGFAKLSTNLYDFDKCTLGLAGDHQIENAQVAVSISQVLHFGYLPLPDEAVFQGLQNARHSGRLERNGRYLFDGAHNIGGAKALREYLDEYVDQPLTIIFSAMKGKNARGFAELIFPKAEKVILTRVDSSRSMTAEDIAAQISQNDYDLRHTQNVVQALRMADEITPESGLVLVTGSLYLVGEVTKVLSSRI